MELSGFGGRSPSYLPVQSVEVQAEESSPFARLFMTEKEPPGPGTKAGVMTRTPCEKTRVTPEKQTQVTGSTGADSHAPTMGETLRTL